MKIIRTSTEMASKIASAKDSAIKFNLKNRKLQRIFKIAFTRKIERTNQNNSLDL
jgi:hypothetical protein